MERVLPLDCAQNESSLNYLHFFIIYIIMWLVFVFLAFNPISNTKVVGDNIKVMGSTFNFE